MNYIKGKYTKNIYNTKDGFNVGLFKLSETNILEIQNKINKTITFKGNFHELNIDENYIFYGDVIDHYKYGFQFEVNSYEKLIPDDSESLITFLSSELFKGVGVKLATNIVNYYKEDVITKILDDKESLYNIKGITKLKADSIINILKTNEQSTSIMNYLIKLGFTVKESITLYNKYKDHTITKIESNIYSILKDTKIYFSKIDSLRHKLNIEDDDERRIKACILYMLEDLSFKNGDTYFLLDDIYLSLNSYLNINIEINYFISIIEELIIEEELVKEEEKYYLKNVYDIEEYIVNRLSYINKIKEKDNKKIDNYLEKLEIETQIKYDDTQKEAIKNSLLNNLFIITGGPGTGKTTIIKAVVDIYKSLYKITDENDIALLAPTGRASKRMSESINEKASTIHRYLKWNKETDEFSVNETNKAQAKLVIVDESSMIDLFLFGNLIKALKSNVKLILVGDYNQLPSVRAGNVLKDLINCNKINVSFLETLYRRDKNSYINVLAKEVNDNNLTNYLDNYNDYKFLECSSSSLVNNLNKIVKQIDESGYDYKKLQIMAPTYKGKNGIDNLNVNLQETLNPYSKDKIEIKYEDVIYRENDKILQLVNDIENNIFNGDIGTIIKIDKQNTNKDSFIYIDFDGNTVKYRYQDLHKIAHGFIISIHKSQGSEFDFVVLPLCLSYNIMLYRKLIYTGITRSKKKLILIGSKEAFIKAVSNNLEYDRKTNLKNKMINHV